MPTEAWSGSDRNELLCLVISTAQAWTKERDIDIHNKENVEKIIECFLISAVTLAARAGKSELCAEGSVKGGAREISETYEFQFLVTKVEEALRN